VLVLDHLDPLLEFVAVEIVDVGMVRAEQQQGRSDVLAACFCVARSCRKPRNGAIPEPAQIMMIGIATRLSSLPASRYPPGNNNVPGRERWSVAVR